MAVVAYHAVVALHLRGALTVKADPAVDLFFCISGFVLAYAHDNDIVEGKLNAVKFLTARWLRFFPVLLLGACLGFAAIQFDPALTPLRDAGNLLPLSSIMLILSLFLIPVLFKSHVLFVNGVYWSLCVELIVNFFYALQGNHLKQKYVYAIWLTSALMLVGFCVWYGTIHFPDDPLGAFGCLIRGVASFFAGVVVFRIWRSGIRAPNVNPWILIGAICIPLLFPYSAPWFKAPLDGLFILIVFPIVVWCAASSTEIESSFFSFIGEASFPLYAIHVPVLIFIERPFVDLAVPLKLAFVVSFTILMTLVAAMVAAFYEKPARALIRGIVRKPQPKAEG
ncbi:hypothetical protein BH10PSE10_BH10PSE10_05600 [soil metagenome]